MSSRSRMTNGTFFSMRYVIHSSPTNSRSASKASIEDAPNTRRYRSIRSIRCRVELLPRWLRNDHIKGTLKRRVTMARTRILISVLPSFQLVLSSARSCAPLVWGVFCQARFSIHLSSDYKRIQGSRLPRAPVAPHPCIRSTLSAGRNHDAVIRIGGRAPE